MHEEPAGIGRPGRVSKGGASADDEAADEGGEEDEGGLK